MMQLMRLAARRRLLFCLSLSGELGQAELPGINEGT